MTVRMMSQTTPGELHVRAGQCLVYHSSHPHLVRRVSSSSGGGSGGNLSCGRRPCRNLITSDSMATSQFRLGCVADDIARRRRRRRGENKARIRRTQRQTGQTDKRKPELVSLKWKHSIARSWSRASRRPDIKRSLKDTDMI